MKEREEEGKESTEEPWRGTGEPCGSFSDKVMTSLTGEKKANWNSVELSTGKVTLCFRTSVYMMNIIVYSLSLFFSSSFSHPSILLPSLLSPSLPNFLVCGVGDILEDDNEEEGER